MNESFWGWKPRPAVAQLLTGLLIYIFKNIDDNVNSITSELVCISIAE